MFSRIRFLVFTTAAAVAGLLILGLAQNSIVEGNQKSVERGYFVISNKVTKDNRDISILLNAEYYTAEYLRELLDEMSRAYPEPERLGISLYSNIEQVRGFVDGRPHHGWYLYHERDDPAFWQRYAHALLFRQNGNEVIRYYVPDGKEESLQTIVVKGRDPAYSQDK